jgi:hypothetical protein
MREKRWFAWWVQMDDKKGVLMNCIRGPCSSMEKMQEDILAFNIGGANIHYEELDTVQLQVAKAILRDKMAQELHSLGQAFQRFHIKSVPHRQGAIPEEANKRYR